MGLQGVWVRRSRRAAAATWTPSSGLLGHGGAWRCLTQMPFHLRAVHWRNHRTHSGGLPGRVVVLAERLHWQSGWGCLVWIHVINPLP